MTDLSYVPGQCLGVVTASGTVIVTGGRPSVGRDLWALLGSVPDVVGVLDVLGVDGISAMPEFGAVVVAGEHLRVVVRGGFVVEVDVDGARVTCDAHGVATWSERAFPLAGVSAWRVASTTSSAGPEDIPLPIAAAVVAAERVECTRMSAGAVLPLAPPVTKPIVPVPAAAPVPAAELAPAPAPAPTAAVLPPPPPAPAPEPAAEQDTEPDVDPRPEPEAGVTLVDASEDVYDAMFGATVAGRTPGDAAVRDVEMPVPQVSAPPGSPVKPETSDADRTISPAEFAALRSSRPPTPAVRSDPPLLLKFPNGREEMVDGLILVGRSPRAVNASRADFTLVVLDDPYISGTHLEVALVDGRALVTDRSTNGTLLEAVGQAPTLLTKGLATPLEAGMRLRLSDQLTVMVVAS